MSYTLAYKDRYRRVLESVMQSDTIDSVAFASIPDDTPTKVLTEWTGVQYKQLLSCVMNGADLLYPTQADEIIWQLIKVLHQPIPFELPEDESGCIQYSTSAGFIKYFPDNPFITGDKSAGWNKEAWYEWADFDSLFPDWADNWIGGLIDFLTGYQTGDVLFNIESLPINPIDAWLSGGGILPKIEIRFSGTGIVEVELLSFPLGGKAIIELDQEPNILDILTGGILDAGAFQVELARDIINFPPDEYPVINIEIPVETTGEHILYIVYIPTVDDSLFPTGFGGGFRGVELCGFEEGAAAMVDNIFWDGCELKMTIGGIESVIVTAAEIQECLDIPEGGGGSGSTSLSMRTFPVTLGANYTNNTTSFTNVFGQLFTPTRANMIVICSGVNMSSSGGSVVGAIALKYDDAFGDEATEPTMRGGNGASGFEFTVTDVFTDIEIGVAKYLNLYARCQTTGTLTISALSDLLFTVIEFDNPEDLYVEDIRINGGELQKKIAGVWLDVTDSLEAMLAAIQADADTAIAQSSSALVAAAAAQTTANNAVATNVTQQASIVSINTLNTTQNGRLTALESDVSTLETNVANHETRLDNMDIINVNQTARIEDLENSLVVLNFGGSWAWLHDFTAAGGGYVSGVGSYSAGIGWVSGGSPSTLIIVYSAETLKQNQLTHIEMQYYTSELATVEFSVDEGTTWHIAQGAAALVPLLTWARIANGQAGEQFELQMRVSTGYMVLTGLRYLGRGDDCPFD